MSHPEHKPGMLRPRSTVLRQWLVSGSTISLLAVCCAVVWGHNRGYLRDFFDYGIVIAAAGKIEAGLKPFTGIRSPMQSATYLLNFFAEQVFGRSYLGLTWGGLVQALAIGLVVRALLVGRLGAAAATLVALIVVLAGPLQHSVFFYNPIGIGCQAAVLIGVALEPELNPARSWRAGVVAGALFLSGTNKLNFHGVTVGLTMLLLLGAWRRGRIRGGIALRGAVVTAVAGLVLPLGFELAWTGASLKDWLANVVFLPTARLAYLRAAADPGMYVRPVHDFYHHVLVRPLAGIGLLLLLGTGAWALHDAWRNRRPAFDWAARSLLMVASLAAGALLMITNHETMVLTSLAYPLTALALVLNYPAPDGSVNRRASWSVIAIASLWAITGGYAAWNGSRLLYGPNPPPRARYVTFHAASHALAYFEGAHLLPDQIDANERLAARLQAMEGAEGRLRGVLFACGLEWMERAYPECIVEGEPVSYTAGTTLNDPDLYYFRRLLDGGHRRVAVQKGWEAWPPSVHGLLGRGYRMENTSGRDAIYHPRGDQAPPVSLADPLTLAADAYRNAAGGNLQVLATRYSRHLALQTGPAGQFFGAAGDTNWCWPFGTYDAEGKAVALLQPGTNLSGVVTFRAFAGPDASGRLLWETPVELGPARREVVLPIELQPAGEPVWLQTAVTGRAAGAILAGWSEMRITHTNELDRASPPPFGSGLVRIWPVPPETTSDQIWYSRAGRSLAADGAAMLPAENWRRDSHDSGLLRVTVQLTPDPMQPDDHVVVTLAWYRASRLEIMKEKEIDPRATPRLTLEGYVPEAGGWVGLLARTGQARHEIRVLSWAR